MHQPSILHRAWAEIDLSALENNVRCIQEILPEHTDFMAVVKADAYGMEMQSSALPCTRWAFAGLPFPISKKPSLFGSTAQTVKSLS